MEFKEAIGSLLDKDQVPASWDSAHWALMEPEARIRAFFSAKVENARFLDRAQGLLFDYMAKVRDDITTTDGDKTRALRVAGREHFVKLMREFMITEGMAQPDEFKDMPQADVQRLGSMARLRLIFDTNVRQAYGYGQWKQGMEPDALKAFPAARLVRRRGVMEARPRHAANIGEVRAKTDMYWWASYQNSPEIGGFGVPWGPFGFNSGTDQQNVSREEAEKLGVHLPPSPPDLPGLNDGLQASTKRMDPALKAKLLAELRSGPKLTDPREAGKEAAAQVRREMLNRGLTESLGKGNAAMVEKYREALAKLPQTGNGFAVHEDGDKITLDDSLGQRLAKVIKLEAPAHEVELAIATKIFETVDRKASEPKTRQEAKKGAPRARHLFAEDLVITPEEHKILESPHEILLVHTADGRLKSAILGTKHNVPLPSQIPAGAVLSHNHPSGRGLSDADVKSALSFPGTTLRVVCRNEQGRIEVISIKFTGKLSKLEIRAYSDIYFSQCADAGDTHIARREALALIAQVIGDTFEAVTRIFQ